MSKKASRTANFIKEIFSDTNMEVPSLRRFPEIDIKKMEKELAPVERGAERGKLGEPPLGLNAVDPVEAEIKDRFQAMVTEEGIRAEQDVVTYNQRLAGFDMTRHLDEIRDLCRSARSDFVSKVGEVNNYLTNFKKRVLQKARDEADFRENNGLSRSAHYPSEGATYLKWGVIAVLFLLETYGNSVFLSKGNEQGLLGGFTEAFYISMLNVGFAVLVGSFVTRYMFHRSAFLKMVGALGLMIALGLSGILNLMVAHYREVSDLGMLAGAGGTAAIDRLSADPFALTSIIGWILFAMGFLFFVIAVIDAHSLDDNYPGYGGFARATEKANIEYAEEMAILVDELTEMRSVVEEDIRNSRDELSSIQGDIADIRSSRDQLITSYKIWSETLQQQGQTMVSLYREANRRERTRSPSSFNQPIELNIKALSDVEMVSIDIDQVANAVTEGKAILDKSIEQFYAEFDQAIAKIDTIDKIASLDELQEMQRNTDG